ncbi:GAF and ANTAR domain-containing protein [Actinopolymorpha sp. B9G3]|uniref:GAF and ANTAR domain-containing protein n=1 Tax=Actinopolymorpha sp. B9G3 TaxID=3158970 RepID=UPI0032D97A29
MDHRGQGLARAFIQLADTLTADFDETTYLQEFCRHHVDLLDIDAAEVLLGDDADSLLAPAMAGAFGARGELPASHRYEGPARQAVRTGEQAYVSDLRTAGRLWPRFVPAAIRLGYAAVHAFPMRLRTQVVGAVCVYRVRPGALPSDQVAIAQALADAATIGLVQHRVRQQQDVLVAQLQGALDSRVIIEQAKGILAERCGVDVDKAFEQMRAFARPRRLKLSAVASGIVRGGGDVAALAAMSAPSPPSRRAADPVAGKGNPDVNVTLNGAVNGSGSATGNGSAAVNGGANGRRTGNGSANGNGRGGQRSDTRRLLALPVPSGLNAIRSGHAGDSAVPDQ